LLDLPGNPAGSSGPAAARCGVSLGAGHLLGAGERRGGAGEEHERGP